MKTLYGLLTVVAFAFLLFGGLFTTLVQIEEKNTDLTTDSLDMIDKYNVYYDNLSGFEDISAPNTNISSNSTNQIDAFFREYAEAKKNVNKFATGLNFLYHIPSLILLSIPFIELSDSSVSIYAGVIWLLIAFLIIGAFYKALRGAKIDNE